MSGGNDGQNGENHPFGTIAALSERFHHFEAFDRLDRLLSRGVVGDDFLAGVALFFEIYRHQKLAHGLRAHAHFESRCGAVAVALFEFPKLLVVDHLLVDELGDFAGIEHDVGSEIDDLFELFGSHVEKEADFGGHAFKVPDMGNGSRQFDMSHPFAADFGAGDFHAALFADVSLVFYSFIFSAVAFPVLHRPEDLFAKKAVPLGLLSAVVYRFGFGNFAVRPFSDFFGRCYADLNGIEIV